MSAARPVAASLRQHRQHNTQLENRTLAVMEQEFLDHYTNNSWRNLYTVTRTVIYTMVD